MVNSTWTFDHIRSLWYIPENTIHKLYPPCNTSNLQKLPLEPRERIIVSIGQFRPEKGHRLQLESFHEFLKTHTKWRGKLKLVLIGSCRNSEDENRVSILKEHCKQLEISESVQFEINISYETLSSWLSRSMIGLHTMWNEHFGIGIVELMAAGVITIAHNSGGPKEDIVVPFQGKTTGISN